MRGVGSCRLNPHDPVAGGDEDGAVVPDGDAEGAAHRGRGEEVAAGAVPPDGVVEPVADDDLAGAGVHVVGGHLVGDARGVLVLAVPVDLLLVRAGARGGVAHAEGEALEPDGDELIERAAVDGHAVVAVGEAAVVAGPQPRGAVVGLLQRAAGEGVGAAVVAAGGHSLVARHGRVVGADGEEVLGLEAGRAEQLPRVVPHGERLALVVEPVPELDVGAGRAGGGVEQLADDGAGGVVDVDRDVSRLGEGVLDGLGRAGGDGRGSVGRGLDGGGRERAGAVERGRPVLREDLRLGRRGSEDGEQHRGAEGVARGHGFGGGGRWAR